MARRRWTLLLALLLGTAGLAFAQTSEVTLKQDAYYIGLDPTPCKPDVIPEGMNIDFGLCGNFVGSSQMVDNVEGAFDVVLINNHGFRVGDWWKQGASGSFRHFYKGSQIVVVWIADDGRVEIISGTSY